MDNYFTYDVEQCQTFEQLMETAVERFDRRILFENETNRWTYSDIHKMIKAVSTNYFAKFDRQMFGLRINNLANYTVLLFSIVITGNIAVLIDEFYTGIEEDCTNSFDDDLADQVIKKCVSSSFINPHILRRGAPEDVSIIAHSSGTTSVCKNVMLSQKNVLDDAVSCMRRYKFDESAVYFSIIPHTHLFGLVGDVLIPMHSGAKVCFSKSKYSFFRDLQTFQPTNLNVPPLILSEISRKMTTIEAGWRITGGRLAKVICSGAALNPTIIDEFLQHDICIYTAYGLTECSPCVTLSSELSSRKGSVGKPIDCCDIKIVDGEVLVRGSNVMKGYYNDPIATKTVVQDGWLHTGDIGYFDDGYLFLAGRKTNLIVFDDGKKIVPEIVEAKIAQATNFRECVVRESLRGLKRRIAIEVWRKNEDATRDNEEKVVAILSEFGIAHRFDGIIYRDYPFEKTALGKIIR